MVPALCAVGRLGDEANDNTPVNHVLSPTLIYGPTKQTRSHNV